MLYVRYMYDSSYHKFQRKIVLCVKDDYTMSDEKRVKIKCTDLKVSTSHHTFDCKLQICFKRCRPSLSPHYYTHQTSQRCLFVSPTLTSNGSNSPAAIGCDSTELLNILKRTTSPFLCQSLERQNTLHFLFCAE